MGSSLPTGEVTFLFTDIEGSTRILNRVGSDRFTTLLDRHHAIVRASLTNHEGLELHTEGDSFFVVFTAAASAVDAAADMQRGIGDDPELAGDSLTVRMGLHAGTAVIGGDNYTGLDVHLAARVSSAASGGQVLVTDSVVDAASAADASFKPLGEFWLKDIDEPTSLSQVVAAGLSSDSPLPRAPSRHPVNAPVDLSTFVGRDGDVERATDALRDARLVTLTGPGGTGKTRLAVEIGSALSREYPDGAFFVPLAGIEDPDAVPNAAIDALDAPMADTSSSPIDNLCAFLQHRSAMIIMDNFEHVLDGAPHVARMLEASPSSRVLATSRTPLGVSGEREIAIEPLSVSDAGVDLFEQRAQAVRSSFEVNEANRADVQAIVRRLDGLPLAIELAAARIRMMSCEAILETLDPLTLAGRTGTDREVTLADTIQWSYDLLAPAEQALLTRLAVFPTGANLDQIGAVTRPSEDLGIDLFGGLGALVDHSLLVGDHAGATPRFRMLETVREFSMRSLAESPDEREIRNRHSHAYLELLEEARTHLGGPEAGSWMIRLGTENANLQAAFAHAVDIGDAETAQRMVAAAWRFWQARGHLSEGTRAATLALALEGSDPRVRAEALDAAGSIAYWAGDAEATRAYYDGAVAIRREHGIRDGLAMALYNLSFPVADQDGLEAVTVVLTEADKVAEEEGDDRTRALALIGMARSWLPESPERSLDYANQSIAATAHLNEPLTDSWSLAMRSAALHGIGDYAASAADLQAALSVFVEFNDLSGIVVSMTGIAEISRRLGDDDVALYMAGAVSGLRETSGIGISTAIDETVRDFAEEDDVQGLPPELKEAWDVGRADPLEIAIVKALAYDPVLPVD